MALLYRRTMPKRMYNFFMFSVLAHLAIFLFVGSHKTTDSGVFITEITYEEETSQMPEALKPQSRVGYLIPPSNFDDMARGVEGAGPSGVGGYGDASTQAVVDLSTTIDRSQATINLNSYDEGDEGALAVVHIASKGGNVKTTEEILAERPISLSKNLPRGTGGTGSMRVGSTIGITQQTPAIKIDKRPPPPTTTNIGKQVEKQVEQKLKVETGSGTQISLAGPIASRGILKKLLPNYPSWCLSQGISGVVKIKIWVEPSGKVREGALIECSSGYPDLDQAVVNALKAWLFAPLPGTVVQESQWGVITFRFVCG